VLKITSKGKVTLKQASMNHTGAPPGDHVQIPVLPDGALRIDPPGRRNWDDVIGIVDRPAEGAATIEEMSEAIGERVAKLDGNR
jgi:hypothetical protein